LGINDSDRIRLYQEMVRKAVEQAESQYEKLDESERRLVELSKNYLEDSIYYLGKGDLFTALSTISYAEGLLDSLSIRERISIEWERKKPCKVVAAGTFDIIHPGHILLLKEASKHGDLYVIVSRDTNARKSKGRETVFPEESRVFIVDNLKPVRKAVLGDEKDILKRVEEIKPDILFLGPDQNIDENWLRKELDRRGLKNTAILRMSRREKKFYPNSSTQVIIDIMKKFCYTENSLL
jgi:FAD synthetase